MSIFIEIKGNPPTRTAQQKGVSVRGGHAHFYEKASVRQAKDELAWKIKPFAPAEPYHGPIALTIHWAFELKRVKFPFWKTTRPDLDNLEKGLLDVMTGLGFWDDDSQICLKTTKKWEVPVGQGFLRISVEEMKKDD
jgi:Holliday junction resolvase RusA-like endonuclease